MRQASCRLALLSLLCASLACGCASFGHKSAVTSDDLAKPSNPPKTTLVSGFPKWGSRRSSGSRTASKDKKTSTKTATSIKQRAEQARQQNKTSGEKSRKSASVNEEDSLASTGSRIQAPEPTAVSPADLSAFDQTTQALIQSELRDATPDEKAQLLEDLKGVPSDMVPKLLGVRRATLQYKNHQPKNSIATTGGTRGNPFENSANGADDKKINSSPSPEETTPLTEGLGAKNPWSAGYAPPPVGSGAPAVPPSNGPAFTPPAQQNGLSPEQLAAQILANNASVGLPNSNSNMANGMIPLQSQVMGNLSNTANPYGSVPYANQVLPSNHPAPVTPNWSQNLPLTTTNIPANSSSPVVSSAPATPVIAVSSGVIPASSAVNPQQNTGWAASSPGGTLPPAPQLHSQDWQQHLQGLIAAAESEVSRLTPGSTDQERQRYIEAHVHLRMLYLMAGEQQRALVHIPGIEPADQEFWQQVLWGTTNYFDARQIPAAHDRATQTVSQFEAAVHRLREKAHLELKGLSFCNAINGYGDVDKLPEANELTPGQRVLLYVEVVNFKSELAADGRYHSRLKPTYEIVRPGGQGELIEQKSYNTIEDVCDNDRHDFYLSFMVDIPANMTLGPHILRLTVEDELSRKVTSRSLNFTVK